MSVCIKKVFTSRSLWKGMMVFCAVEAWIPVEALSASATFSSEGLRREEERIREMRKEFHAPKGVFQKKKVLRLSKSLPKERLCFKVDRIELKGGQGHFEWLKFEAQRFSHQCIGLLGIEKIVSTLNLRLVQEGYVTSRVVFPEQNLKTGVLLLHLYVGRIGEIRMVSKLKKPSFPGLSDLPEPRLFTCIKDRSFGTWRNAFPVRKGQVLNIRHLEQGVERMKRLKSQKVGTRIEPGVQANTSILYIEREPVRFIDRFHAGLTLDNSGSSSLSHEQFSGYFTYENPLGLNDLLNFNWSTNARNPAPDHRGQSAAINYAIPFGYSLLTFSRSYSRFSQVVQGNIEPLLSSGQSNTSDGRLNQTFIRTSKGIFGGYVGASHNRANSFLNGEEIEVQRRKVTYAELGFNGQQLIGDRASLGLEGGVRHGVKWGGVQEDFPWVDVTGQGLFFEKGLTARPTIFIYNLNYDQIIPIGKHPLQYAFYWHGQHTRNTTLSVDQIAIGSRYTVRGFDGESVLMSENGYFMRNDLSLPIKSLLKGGESYLYWGIDYGRVWGPSSENQVGTKLSGTAVGIRGKWRGFWLDIAAGTPLYKPKGFKTGTINPYLTLSYQF